MSVVVPCYNLGLYLAEAVDSVLAQTLDELEVIVVDDGSPDDFTRDLLSTFHRPRTRILHQEGRGVAAARNNGIRHARGRYIACLDADDRMLPEYLEKAVEVLERERDVGFVASNFRMFEGDQDIWYCGPIRFPEMLLTNRCHTCAVFRRSAWEEAGGYCETLSRDNPFEDWDFWLTFLELGHRGEVIPEILFEYRVRRNSRFHGPAEEPERQGRYYREVWERHAPTYAAAIGDLAELVGAELAKERGFWLELLRRRSGISGSMIRAAARWRNRRRHVSER